MNITTTTTKSRLRDIENQLVVTSVEREWGGQYRGRGLRGTNY